MKKRRILACWERITENNVQFAKHPLVEVLGDNRVLIENHMGILSYCLEEIRIKVCFGNVQVKGIDLQLMEIGKDQLVICGKIDAVQLNRR